MLQLKTFQPLLSKSFVRNASTRNKRIQVQLLKDFPKYGVKGEIVEVKPSVMRNMLHVDNGACYIIPKMNLGPRIPVVDRRKLEEQKLRAQQLARASQEEADKERALKIAQTATMGADETSLNALTKLMFKRKRSDNGSSEEKPSLKIVSDNEVVAYTYDIVNAFPNVLPLEQEALSTGFLKTPLTPKSLAERVFRLTGASIPDSAIKLEYHVPNSKSVKSLPVIDFIGTYTVSIEIPNDSKKVVKKIRVRSTDDKDLVLVRPDESAETVAEEEAK